jgi:hypothetical protein
MQRVTVSQISANINKEDIFRFSLDKFNYSVIGDELIIIPKTQVIEVEESREPIITRYDKCDISGKNYIEENGFDKNLSEAEMIEKAIQHKCPILIRNGRNGKWYLKSLGRNIEELKEKLAENTGKSRDGVYVLLIELPN